MNDDRRRPDRSRERGDDIDSMRRAIYGRNIKDEGRPRSRSRSPARGSRDRPMSISPERSDQRDHARDRSSDRRGRSRSPNPNRRVANVSSTDPKLRAARVFVGRLPAGVTEAELTEIFKPYGRLLDVRIIKNFAFVQFEEERDARLAVERENGSLLKGTNIDVKMAEEGKKAMAHRNEREDTHGRDRDHYGNGDRDYGRPPPGEYPPRRPPPRDDFREGYRDPPYRPSGPPGPPLRAGPPPPAAVPSDRPPYECQFVLHQPSQRNYAEMIEDRLMALRMRCQHQVLKTDAELPLVVTEVTRRRVPYAIALTAQNEQHRSLTLNILHGTPQEHRNMPLEDALGLMARDFEEVRDKIAKGKGLGIAPTPVPVATPPAVRSGPPPPSATADPSFVPPSKQTSYLLNLLADNRILTLEELDNVMDYLAERRRKLAGDEQPPKATLAVPVVEAEQAIDKQTAALQNNILSMLNGSGDSATDPPTSIDTTPPIPNLNFGDPSVQKALDNLISSGPNLLASISSLSAAPTSTTPNAPIPSNSIPPSSQPQVPEHSLPPIGMRMGGPHNSPNLAPPVGNPRPNFGGGYPAGGPGMPMGMGMAMRMGHPNRHPQPGYAPPNNYPHY